MFEEYEKNPGHILQYNTVIEDHAKITKVPS